MGELIGMDKTELILTLAAVFAPIVASALALVFNSLRVWINGNVKNTVARGALNTLNDIVYNNVKAAQETVAKEIKARKGKKFDRAKDGAEIKKIVMDQIKAQAKKDILDAAKEHVDDIEGYISSTVEMYLAKIKDPNQPAF